MADVRVYFATNRNYIPEQQTFGTASNPDGIAGLRFGYADFTADPVSPARRSISVYPDNKEEKDINQTGGGMFMNDLREVMSGGPRTDTLIFIHGFNVTFDGALQAGALLAQSLTVEGKPVNIVVFTWPSDGKAIPLMSYYSDREDARVAGPAIARAFLKLAEYLEKLDEDKYCQRQVHLLVHSMGAYVLRNSLQALIVKDKDKLIRLFDQIMLAAPDEDDDTFEFDAKLRLLPRIGRQVTVYFNPFDKGLLVSDKTKANPDRLGSDGPRMVDLIPKKIVSVDCSAVSEAADRFIQHSYYIRSEAMAADMSAVMSGHGLDGFPNRQFVPRNRAWRIKKETGKTLAQVPAPAVPERKI